MSIGSVSSVASTTYAVPVTGQAQEVDEATESQAVKAKEAETGKDSAVPRNPNTGKALDISV